MLVFEGTNRRHDAVAFSPDGRGLAAAGAAAAVVTAGLVSRPEDTGVEVWDLSAGPGVPRRLFADQRVTRFRYDPGGRWVFADLSWSSEWSWSVGAADPTAPGPAGRAGDGLLGDVGPGRLLVRGDGATRVGGVDWLACLSVTGVPPFPVAWRVDCAPQNSVWFAALLPDGRAVTVDRRVYPRKADDYTVTVRAADTGRIVASAPLPNRTPGPLTVSPDGSAVVMNAGGSLYVWRSTDITAPARKVVFGKKHCTGLAFHPSGAYVLAAGNDGTVRRLDATTWKQTASYAWRAGKARSVAVSPDGLLAAAGTDKGRIVVWDLDD